MQIFLQLSLFLAIFIEGSPFIGALIPGGIIALFFAGVFSRIGTLNLYFSLISAFAGTLSIDFISYYLGSRHGEKTIHKYSKYILVKREFIHKIADLIKIHPYKTLIFGKFNPATRAVAPFMAGMKHIGKTKYIIINILASASWVSALMFAGYFFGGGFKIIKFIEGWLMYSTIIFFIFAYIFYLVYDTYKNQQINKEQI